MNTRTIALAAVLCVAFARASFSQPGNLQAYAAACEQERGAAERFYRWKGQVLDDQNALRELGFQRTSDQLEAIANETEKQEEKFKEQLKEMALDSAFKMVLESARTYRPIELTRADAIAKRNLYAKTPAAAILDEGIQASLKAGKDVVLLQSAQLKEIAHYAELFHDKVVDKIGALNDLDNAGDLKDVDSWFDTASGLAALVAPELSEPLQFVQLGVSLGRLQWNEHEAEELLRLNEAQLQRLARLSDQLKADANQLHRARIDLEAAQNALGGASCDSTNLVKREPSGDSKNAAKDADAGKSGLSTPAKVGITLGMVGAAGGTVAWAVSKAINSQHFDTLDGSNSGSSSGSGASASIMSYTTFVCSRSAGQCSGTITINIPGVMSTGHIWVYAWDAGGNHLAGDATVSSASVPGSVRFTLTRPYGGLNACMSQLTLVQVYNGNTNGAPTYALNASIPVSCQ